MSYYGIIQYNMLYIVCEQNYKLYQAVAYIKDNKY